jgi:autotransporter-associated beta strand protein
MSGFTGLNNTTFSNPTGLSSEYAKLTKGAAYGGTGAATITLNNLTSGHVYLVQVWVNDSRTDGNGRNETVTNAGGNTVTLDYNNTNAAGGAGQYTIGRFVADSTTQSFILQGNASSQLNAIQLRDITNIGHWIGTGGAAWNASATNNFADNPYSAALNTTNFATAKIPLNAVTFGNAYWDNGTAMPVTQTNITVDAAGVSVGTVYFDNSAVNYTVENASGTVGISGTTALIKDGSGQVTLNSVNSYTGGTTVNGGLLKLNLVGRSGNQGLRANAITSLGTLELYNTATGVDNVLYQNSSFSGAGTLTKTGAGYLTFHTGTTIANFTGTLDVQQGTLAFNNMGGGATAPTSTLNIASGAFADLRYNSALSVGKLTGSGTLTHSHTDAPTVTIGANNASSTFNGVITKTGGTLSVTKAGAGTLTLTGINGYNGLTTISGGTLQLGDGTTDGSLLTTSAIIDNGVLAFNLLGNQSYSQLISGSGALTKSGPGALTLSNTNIFSGATQITGGTIILSNALALQNSAYDTTGATGLIGLTVTGFATPTLGGLNGNVDLATALTGYSGVTGLTLNPQAGITASYAGSIADGATGMTLTKTGAGTQILSGVNSYSGGTTLSAGMLVATLASSLPGYNSPGQVIINGGVLSALPGDGTTTGWSKTQLDALLSNATQTSGALGIDTSAGDILQSDAVTLSNLNTTFGLTKQGANTLTLDQVNTYTGNTTISGGTLALNASGGNAIAGNVTIGDAMGTDILQLNAANQIADTSVLTFTSGGSGNSAIFRLNGNDETVKGIATSVAASAVIENHGPTAATNTLTVNTAGSSYTYDGILRNNSGSGNTSVFALAKDGAGTLTLKNSNGAASISFTGLTTINGGTLNLGKGGNYGTLPAGNTVLVNSAGTLRADVTDALGYYGGSLRVIELMGGAMTVRAGVHVNMAALSMTGGTLTSEGPGPYIFNYIFNTNLTVNASAATAMINCTAIILRGSGNNGTPGPVTFFVADGEAAVDLLVTASILNDPGIGNALIKAGEGLMQLSNTNTYRNGTAIAAGTLKLAVTNAMIPSGALTVAAAGTLDVSNVTQAVAAFTNAPGGTLRTTVSPDVATCGTLTVSSGVDVSGMIVNVSNSADLRPGRSYTLLRTTSGTITGTPVLSGTSYLWSLRKENGDTELAIRMVGTIISFQ